ncbi:MAG: cation-translocating P-type ATPase [Planctomycetota bacterium]
MSDPASTSPPRGLSSADARDLLAEHGPNEVPAPAGDTLAVRLLRQFQNPLIYLLLFALAVDLAAWWLEDAGALPLEAAAIALILVVNAALGLYQEGRAEAALERLRALAAPLAWVERDGALVQLPAREVVPGDLLRLEAGTRVPADACVLPPGGLLVDESLLTGESVPVEKDKDGEVSSGTLLVRGTGWLRVLRTGPQSAMGRLAGLLQSIEPGATPLERRLEAFARRVMHVVLVLAVLVTAAGVALEGLSRVGPVFLFAVALAVAAVPEGLPAVLTLTLAMGVERMAKRKAVVRRLAAVEALGSVTVIATDKTGTLTENRMRVRELELADRERALRAMVLASDADVATGAGDPLELALLARAAEEGLDPAALAAEVERVGGAPFDSERRLMRTSVREGGAVLSYLKGAPEALLARCALDEPERARWLAAAAAHAGRGAKVLGLAWGPGEAEEGLSWLGLVALWDPPRAAARESLARARAAGIRVLMLTGDHPETALAIAEQVGIEGGEVVTGAELEALEEAELAARVARANVFARVSPEHKLRLIEALQRAGEIVAMTGDGVNDAPALRRAEVGVAMGRGSDVAREAADLVLLDDDFATIVAAIEEGRSVYENIQKFIRFLFGTNLSELIVVLLGTAGSVWLELHEHAGVLLLPLTAAQILWINLVSDSFPALSLALDRNPEVLDRPPRAPDAPLLDRPNLAFVLATGVLLAVVPLLLLVVVPGWGYGREVTRSVAFHALVIGQVLTAYHTRRLLGRSPTNHAVTAAVLGVIALQLLAANFPPLYPFLGLKPVPPPLYLGIVAAVLLSFLSTGIATWAVGRAAASEAGER